MKGKDNKNPCLFLLFKKNVVSLQCLHPRMHTYRSCGGVGHYIVKGVTDALFLDIRIFHITKLHSETNAEVMPAGV